MTIFWIYVVIQLVSTAYGITVINSARKIPALRKRLRDAGYTERDKNSLYKFNDWLKYFLKGFIPFYYAYKAQSLVNSSDPVGLLMREEIDNGNYITKEDEELFRQEAENADLSLAYDPNIFKYEDVGTYKAKKLDLNEIYDEDETPIEYITREFEKDSSNKITPFVTENNTTIVVEKPSEEKVEVKQPDVIVVKEDNKISNSDIAAAISELSPFELKELSDKILSLADNKEKNSNYYEKDVA